MLSSSLSSLSFSGFPGLNSALSQHLLVLLYISWTPFFTPCMFWLCVCLVRSLDHRFWQEKNYLLLAQW
jgi:hypothetical protein